MSSFFTTPASQRKRKRDDATGPSNAKRRNTTKPTNSKTRKAKPTKPARDESISGSGSEDESPRRRDNDDDKDSEGSEDDDETAAERRLRLAEKYLQNIKGSVDEVGFDAEDIDRDLIAERLQEDVAETKGRLHRHITSTLDFPSATATQFRTKTLTTTSIAICPPYAYTVSKDIQLIKWKLPVPPPVSTSKKNKAPKKPPIPVRQRPTKLLSARGNRRRANDSNNMHHTAPILCVAASETGKFVATGGADKKLIIWSAEDLKPLKVFTQHRDAVTGLAFRKGTNQLYSSSKDRTIKTWSLNELAYVETLFGHQDEVVDVAAGANERCISAGARDRTARVWKVVEETQLVFRGGGGEKRRPKQRQEQVGGAADDVERKHFAEGAIDRVALVDEESFVTGSDNGSISLWTLHKKKPTFTLPLAHGLDPAMKPEEASAETDPDKRVVPERQPRWITALATVPYSDLVVSGSWDGQIKVWRVGEGKRSLEAVGVLDGGINEGDKASLRGCINDLGMFERGERGKETLCVVAALGTEHRLGRWKHIKQGKNGAVVFEVPRLMEAGKKTLKNHDEAKV